MPINRRDFLATSTSAALAAVFARPHALLGQEPVFTPIRRNVGCFTMRGGTVGWLVNPDAVAIVDTQYPAEAQALLRGLQQRSGARAVDILLNTHHHGDHTGGNAVFRGSARKVVAHAKAAEHMRYPPGGPPPGGQPPADQLFPDTTFEEEWTQHLGDERVLARYYGRAHTSGDAVITFERANVVHMGDLMFNQRHPVVDSAAGATLRGWMSVLERTVRAHDRDTLYIFGHANTGLPVTGDHAALTGFRNYFEALLTFVERQSKAGRSRDEILAMREPLRGFESYGPFGPAGAREALTNAVREVLDA